MLEKRAKVNTDTGISDQSTLNHTNGEREQEEKMGELKGFFNVTLLLLIHIFI